MGAPGAGKGTQAPALAAHHGVPAISTGDIFRANVKSGTELGKKVEALLAAGDLVPDSLTEEIIADRLDQPDTANGFLLDGFPRNMHQVEALDAYLTSKGQALDAVVFLDVDPEVLITRLLRRAELEGRADDNEETIRRRMDIYSSETKPLLDHYAAKGLLVDVNGIGSVEEVDARIQAAVKEHLAK
ncbi:adenylate kinase [Propionibacterium sp. oral taxon 192 str. F0372]|nr:adenylate kinase [Propionibacterium sp. oral taxon 192 str. F0372]